MENKETNDIVRVFTGSMVLVKMVQSHLEEAGIYGIIKDTMESGLRGGFGGGLPGQIQLFVRNDQEAEAKAIVAKATEGMETN